jgi:hypothetical protein
VLTGAEAIEDPEDGAANDAGSIDAAAHSSAAGTLSADP